MGLLPATQTDDEDLKRQLGLLRSNLRRKSSKVHKNSASAAASSSSSSSSSESSDSEGEAERRYLKERARQRLKAARDVSVNALPVLERKRSLSSPLSTISSSFSLQQLPDANRSATLLDRCRSEERAGCQSEVVSTSVEQLDQLFSLPSGSGLGPVAEAGVPSVDVAARSKPMARVEVCMGGKCKKLGAQNVLDAFRDSLPATAVESVGCKCLKVCGRAVNVRLSQDDGQESEMLSQVDVLDVHQLLRVHFPQFATPSSAGEVESLPNR